MTMTPAIQLPQCKDDDLQRSTHRDEKLLKRVILPLASKQTIIIHSYDLTMGEKSAHGILLQCRINASPSITLTYCIHI